MKKKDYLSLSILITSLVIISFGAGFFLEKEIDHEEHTKRDTLIFRDYRSDSIKLYVVMKDGKLQSFWYSKTKRWTIKPTVFK